EHFDHCAPRVNALDDVHAVHHRSGGALPFGDHEHVPRAQRIVGKTKRIEWALPTLLCRGCPLLRRAEGRVIELDYRYRVPVHNGEPVPCRIEGHGRWYRIAF